MDHPYVLHSIVSIDAIKPLESVFIPTFVLSVELLAMGPRPALLESLFPVSTPLLADYWESVLRNASVLDQYEGVPKGLHSGSDIGISSLSLQDSFSPSNHYCSPDAHDFILKKYSSEISLGRVSPGFSPKLTSRLFGPYCTAAFNGISSSSGKLHATLDLSYP